MITPLDYLDYIRSLPCLICGKPGEPHHLEAVGMGRNRNRELKEHYTTIPLCRNHHIEIETVGLKAFETKYNVNLWREAMRLLTYTIYCGITK